LDKPVPLDPGPNTCVARASGYQDAKAVATLREGETQSLELKLVPSSAPAPSSSAPPLPPATTAPASAGPAPPAPQARPGGSQRLVGLVVGGAGGAGVVVGAVLGIVAKTTYDGAKDSYCKLGVSSCSEPGVDGGVRAHHEAAASTGAFIAGGALLAAGGVLYFTAPKTKIEIAPSAGPRTAGLSVVGVW
jgi:hypothetical protein